MTIASTSTCQRCDEESPDGWTICPGCIDDVPPALVKSTVDAPWDYFLGLRDGTEIHFGGANFNGQTWVHLKRPEIERGHTGECSAMHPPYRGIDVRFTEIAWVYETGA